jgi:hypothetical protein
MCHKQPDFCMLASYFALASEIRIDRYSVFEPTGRANARPMTGSVGIGSREENASKQKTRAPFRFHRNGKGSSVLNQKFVAF